MHRIEAGGRLIEKKQRRLMDQRAAEREQLPHSAREAASGGIAFRLQVHLPEQSLDPRVQFVRRNPVGAGKKTQVLEHGQIADKD